MFSYLRVLFNNRTEQLPVVNVSKSLDLPRLILTLCTSLVTSVSGTTPPSSALSKTPRTKSSNVILEWKSVSVYIATQTH